MPIALKMPALSPTMEEGTLAKWLVKAGDTVKSGDILAEIETDKATMEFEAVDEGTIGEILVAEGSDGVKVGTVVATMSGDGEQAAPVKADVARAKAGAAASESAAAPAPAKAPESITVPAADRLKASPLAKRIAEQTGVDLGTITGTGPGGRIVKADVESKSGTGPAQVAPTVQAPTPAAAPAPTPAATFTTDIPHEAIKLTNIRKTIAHRLTESKQ